MKKICLFPICIIASMFLFNGCDEEKDNKLFLLLFAGGMNNTPVVNLAASASLIAEGDTSTITASIPVMTNKDVTVIFQLAGTATATADYTIPGSTIIVIPAGSTSGRTSVVITAVDDGTPEDDEDVVVGITGVTNATAGTAPTIRITDAGAMPVVSLVASATPIAENGGTSTITASIPAPSGSAVTVEFELAGAPAAPADYTVTGSTTITIPAGITSGSTDVDITAVDDALLEGDEVVVVSITGVTNATAGTAPTIRITDDEDSLLTVTGISPASGSTGLSQGVMIIITFNKPTDGTFGTVTLTYDYGIGWDTYTFLNEDENCTMGFNASKNILTLNPYYDLQAGSVHAHITVSGFRDVDGTLMEMYDNAPYNFLTWTRAAYSYTPVNGAIDVDGSANIKIGFNGELGTEKGTVLLDYNSTTYGSGTVTFTDPGNCTMSLELGVFGHHLVINPTTDLLEGTTYSNIRVSGFKDPYGHDVASHTNAGYSFTTAGID